MNLILTFNPSFLSHGKLVTNVNVKNIIICNEELYFRSKCDFF